MYVKLRKTGFHEPTKIFSTIFSSLSHRLSTSLFNFPNNANDFYIHISLNIQIWHKYMMEKIINTQHGWFYIGNGFLNFQVLWSVGNSCMYDCP